MTLQESERNGGGGGEGGRHEVKRMGGRERSKEKKRLRERV